MGEINVEIKITKSTIITFCICVVLCISSFCIGRYIRVGRISGTSEQLISGIVQAGDDTDKIINELTLAGASAESAANYGRIIAGVIEELRNVNEEFSVSTNEAIRAVESNKRITEIVKSASSSLSNTTGNALEDAIERAENYERLIESLQEALRNSTENN